MSGLLETLVDLLQWIGQWIVDLIKRRPGAAALALLAFVRLFGTVIDSGSRGVFFRFGRAKKVLEPGFHLLFPIVHRVRKMHIRSATVNLPPQTAMTRDGLVYEVDANFVYHIEHPIAAAVEIDDLRKGCHCVAAMVLLKLVQQQDQASLADREPLDDQFHQLLQQRLKRWGLVVEQAGLQSIAPSKETILLTQLRFRCRERKRLYDLMLGQSPAPIPSRTTTPTNALTLLGAGRRMLVHSTARYQGFRRRAAANHKPTTLETIKQRASFKVGDHVWVNWQKSGAYFPAAIRSRRGNQVDVKYDDGDEETTTTAYLRRQQPKPTSWLGRFVS